MFPCEFYEVFRNILFTEHLHTTLWFSTIPGGVSHYAFLSVVFPSKTFLKRYSETFLQWQYQNGENDNKLDGDIHIILFVVEKFDDLRYFSKSPSTAQSVYSESAFLSQKCSFKKVFLKILQNSQEKICVGAPLFHQNIKKRLEQRCFPWILRYFH